MKILLLLVLAITIASCASRHQVSYVGGHQQPIVAWDSLNNSDPCQDSLFLALQNKPYSQLTAYEQTYFQQKWDECNGIPGGGQGSTPEWILATFDIVGLVSAVILLSVSKP